MSKYFPNSKSLRGRMKVELDLPNYATKASGVGTLDFTKKTNLANLKSDVHKF